MNTSRVGSAGEQAASAFLVRQGFEVLECNFKTPRCEIDIIARKRDCLYFVEVKYRQNDYQGGGLDAITTKKQLQMRRAAEIWLQSHPWHGEMTLSAIEVSANYEVTEFIESIE